MYVKKLVYVVKVLIVISINITLENYYQISTLDGKLNGNLSELCFRK